MKPGRSRNRKLSRIKKRKELKERERAKKNGEYLFLLSSGIKKVKATMASFRISSGSHFSIRQAEKCQLDRNTINKQTHVSNSVLDYNY